jgi:phage-related protein
MEQIIMTRPNGDRAPLASRRTATAIKSATQTWNLNADETVVITVESPFPQQYEIGDKITVFGRDYTLNRLPPVKKTGMHEYQYTLTFEGIQYDLLRVQYELSIETSGNQLQDVQGDSLTGTLRKFMEVLIANANRVFPGQWSLGECPETEYKTLTFDGENCLAVMQNLCNQFTEGSTTVEFDINKVNGVYVVDMKKVGSVLPYTFQFGRGGGMYELTRQNVTSSDIVTKLYVFGSSENISLKYRADRLCLPGCTKHQSFIQDNALVAKYGIIEGRKVFDKIKPHYDGNVTSIVAGNVLQFVDSGFPFDLMAKNGDETIYLVPGENAKIHFNTGNLAGYEFEVTNYEHSTRKFTLKKFQDDRGDVFPNDTSTAFQFGQGDKYKILGIIYPDSITNAAESELQEESALYYPQVSQPKVQYALSLEKNFLKKLVGGDVSNAIVNAFVPGDYLHIIDHDIDVDKSIRIKGFTRDILDEYKYTLTISDTVTTSTTTRVLQELAEIDKIIQINNLKDPARARANWRTSREVLDMVFDPDGDYYTDRIKPLSIDTSMLSVGAKSMQFGLTNTVIQPNFGGNKNVVSWKGGVLTHYTIKEDSAVSWVIADGSITFTDDNARYLYAKCERNGTAGTFLWSNQQIKVEDDANYYHFLIGTLSSVDTELQVRSLALTYGFTTINGRFIKTGRVESADGNTYFDLDNGEIGGRIVFTRNGEEKTLAELGEESSESQNFINNTLPGLLQSMNNQIDGKIETWYTDSDPSTAWTTQEQRAKHVGDLWFNTSTNEAKRYNSSYAWELIRDKDAIQALSDAATAQDTADGKRRVFVSTPYPPYDIGDLWVQGASGDLMRCGTSRQTGAFVSSDWVKATKYTGDENLNDFIQNTYDVAIADIYHQLDGVIETHFGNGVPTLNNAPAVDWNTTKLREEHLGDMYYDNDSGIGYRFSKENGTYKWVEVRDTGVADALAAAAKAQDTADGKRRVFTAQPYPPYDVGDLWASGIFLKRCITARTSGTYNAADWDDATNYTGDENLNAFINGVFDETVSDIYNQLDGKLESWYSASDPSTAWTTFEEKNAHIGDQWYNITAKTLWRYQYTRQQGFSWAQIENATAIAAAEAASHAQDTADGKRRVFTARPNPPYDVGDLWAQGSTGDLKVCKTAKASGQTYSSSDWVNATKYTDNTAFNNFVNNVYNVQVTAFATQIDGKIETWFQSSDPSSSWLTLSDAKKHIGDLWFNTTSQRLYRWENTDSDNFAWQEITNKDALDAMAAASQAQDTADGKRRVFVAQPTTPYDIGDLWVDGRDLRRCITAKASGQAYNVNDWVVAVYYDNTQTTIDGGIVTSGTIQVAGDNQSILAGMTGQGTTAASIRFWAGASFENRATAPYRVRQDGGVVMTKADITGKVNATSGAIGGFEIANGRIGSANTYDSGTGLSLVNSNIRFRSQSGYTKILAAMGDLNWIGFDNLLDIELVSTDPYLIGEAVFIKCESGDGSMEHWYTQRATDIRGNQFAIGKTAMFHKGYIGQAYTDTITNLFGLTHIYHFTSAGVSNLGVNLPTKAQVDSKVSNAVVIFDIEIMLDRDFGSNVITLKTQDNSNIYYELTTIPTTNGERISHQGWKTSVKLKAGCSIRLRYYIGKWQIITWEREFTTGIRVPYNY